MITEVRKYLVLGTQDDLDLFFERAQQNGNLEFISHFSRKNIELPPEIHNLILALKILKKLPLRKKYDGIWEISYANHIAKRIIELRDEVEKMNEEKRLLEAEIHRVAPFGDFSMEDIDYIQEQGHRKIQFFCKKTDKTSSAVLGNEVLYVGTEYDLDYFIAINTVARTYAGMIEMRIDRSVSELKLQLQILNESIHDLEVELKSYSGHKEFLNEALLEQYNDYNLSEVKKDVARPIQSTSLFSIEAWVPKSKETLLHGLIDGLSVHCERIKIEDEDKIPTFMENEGYNKMGEDLVKIYDTPATTDKDPSGWVFWSFALFFAMIVADGGYGILYLGLALYMKYKFPDIQGYSKRMLKMVMILSGFVIVWGVLTCSFFGMNFSRNSILGEISPTQYMVKKKAEYHLMRKDDVYQDWVHEFPKVQTATTADEFLDYTITQKGHRNISAASAEFNDNILLEISLFVGVIHLSLSFLRYLRRNLAGLGWVIFMVGGYLFFPIKLNATSMLEFMGLVTPELARDLGIQLICFGIGTSLILAVIQKKWAGLGEILNAIQVFADVLSYLRLYALALAGIIMAETFNDMGVAIGLLGGFIVVLLGHSVNILLGVMAGVIHGLRLNFIEWYHFSFDGGGRLFKPLRLLKSEEE